ncbi:cell wall-binding repeat-containing protein [uncultured Metabacillus sp.]|uniref:cell wall-binding repeat-containing protein n=1 Tax=uncultured Metabacillus sp. TaxID=2860135 RepID=UPI00262E2113|nr:cell wall-binding repeat-containing protein [uncultured Metabacillus sp.]
MKFKIFIVIVTLISVISFQGKPASASESLCGYTPEKGKNPSFQQVNCLLTTISQQYGVPPEIAKAVATEENGAWKQFKSDGEPIVTTDGGIGIMQLTTYDPALEEKIKYNAIGNIEEGMKRLAENFYSRTDLPRINDHSPEKLESWYFAIMAYNGTKPINSPFQKCTNSEITRNTKAYQERVYANLESDYEVTTKVDQLPFKAEDFQYTCDSKENIQFKTKHYNLDDSLTDSKEFHLQKNEYIEATLNTNLREKPSTTSSVIRTISKNTVMSVQGQLVYDAVSDRMNRFAWVPAKIGTQQGFVTSKYINRIGSRISGIDRYKTAVQISKAGWGQANTVILARGDMFPDALAGGPLAYKYDAPILLTHNNKLTPVTKEEIKRLKAKNVIILGGVGAISDTVKKTIETELKLPVERISGINRFETSVKIAQKLGGNFEKAILAYGRNYPDALAIAPYAARQGYPILLTEKEKVSTNVNKILSSVEETIIVGGTSVISPVIEKQLDNAKRLRGADRFATAVQILNGLSLHQSKIFFTYGFNFADALTGSVLAAKFNAPLLLVDKNSIPSVVSENINGLEYFYILGGNGAISETLIPSFQSLIH